MGGKLFLILLSLAVVKSEINQSLILIYKNYIIPDIQYVCLNFNITSNISEKCGEQLEVVCGNITLFTTMLDATSKFPYSGLGYSSRSDFGNFDQCLTVDHKYPGGRILGKHCTAGLLLPDILGNATDVDSMYKLSICKPDACSAEDFTAIASSLIGNFPPLFQDALCQTIESNTEITASDIVTILIFSIVLLLMLLSTAYDFYLHRTKSKSHHPLFLAFSVISNGKKLLHISKHSKEQIQTFHGLKMISMMWIVAGHGFAMWPNISVTNADDVSKWIYKRYTFYISTAPLAVDTFFFISGFLLAFQYLKQKSNKSLRDQVMAIPKMYLHRYLRLTPALFMVFLVTISIFKHLGTGPTWTNGVNTFAQNCRDNWWSFLLYIQNYYSDFDYICLPQTWYLSADMQMFLLSPLIIIPITLNLRKSSGFMVSMIELLILNLFLIALPMCLKLFVQQYRNDYDTHSRLINYFIGMMLAVFMRAKQDKPFLYMIKKEHIDITNLVVWIVMLLGMLTTVMCYQEIQIMSDSHVSKSVFDPLMRPAWCIGLSWIVYSSYHGYGGIVNWILSGPVMQIIGRLTYCIYLTHISILIYYLLIRRSKSYFADYNIFYEWCGHFTVSIIVSVFWTLAFESPLLIIEKYLLGGGNARRKQPQNGNTDAEMKRDNVH